MSRTCLPLRSLPKSAMPLRRRRGGMRFDELEKCLREGGPRPLAGGHQVKGAPDSRSVTPKHVSSPALQSSATARREISDTPTPARTACLRPAWSPFAHDPEGGEGEVRVPRARAPRLREPEPRPQQEGLAFQIVDGDAGAARPRMPGGHRDDDVVVHERTRRGDSRRVGAPTTPTSTRPSSTHSLTGGCRR